MHELSIAQNIVESVLAEAQSNNAERVSEVDVEIGELMQLDRNALAYGLRLLMTGPLLKGAHVHVRVQKASFSCEKCGAEWDMTEAKKQLATVPDSLRISEPDSKELPLHFLPQLYPTFVKCPSCGSVDIKTVEGQDIRIKKVSLVRAR